jgi:hypothetical protein
MTDPLDRLLGSDGPDVGCDAAFEALDQLAEMILRGVEPGVEFAPILTHAANCSACGEDTEGYLAVLRAVVPPRAP